MGADRARPKGGLAAVVLAGGRSKRFRSSTPKVLHPVLGLPLIIHVLDALRDLHATEPLDAVSLVVAPGGEVEKALAPLDYPFRVRFAVQRRPLGTADATKTGLAKVAGAGEVLVLAGDAPLVRPSSLEELVRERRRRDAPAAVLTAVLADGGSYGRIIRNGDRIAAVVEARDATPEQLEIREINTCTYAFSGEALRRTLPNIRNDNAQGEYYLTDAVAHLASDGELVSVRGEPDEVLGANTRAEYAAVTRLVRERVLDRLMAAGVTVVDPDTTYVDAGVEVGADTVLRPNTFLEGTTRVGEGCDIGPNVRLLDTRVEDGATVTFAVAVGSRIGPGAEVGPFASLRAGTVLGRGAKAGTFVEMKAAVIGEDSKVPHLAYMGDVRVGKRSNIGAGTITCNYNPFELAPDGSTKHQTWIGDDVYVSSDTMLVAPVRLGHGSQTGAGSVVTRNVKANELVYGVPARPAGPAKERADGKKRKGAASAKSKKKKSSGRKKG